MKFSFVSFIAVVMSPPASSLFGKSSGGVSSSHFILKFHPKPIIYGLGILLLQHAVFAISPSQAPTMTTIQKMIRGCDGAANDQFGYDLAVKGDWAAIGAYGVSSYTGAVYLYKHDGNHWVFMQSLTASDGATDDWFGFAVAMSGTGHLVVGAYGDDDKGSTSGSVYLYTLNSSTNTWGNQQKIVASDGAAGDYFGFALAMSGTGHLVVGAPLNDDKGSSSGSVYLYTLNSSSNTWGDEQKIVSSDGATDDWFGFAVAMSGTGHLVVGAHGDDDKGYNAGAVYLYTLNSTSNTWGDEQKIVASDGATDDYFGRAVAMSGTGHLVVGARGDDDKGSSSGSVYLYTLNSSSNTWGDEQKIVSSDGATDDWFGFTVAMSGTGHLVVGARQDDDKGYNAGAVYLYTLNSTSNTWGDEQKIVASDGAEYDYFGYAIAMSGTGHLVVGAYGDDDMGSASGSVYAIGEGSLYPADARTNAFTPTALPPSYRFRQQRIQRSRPRRFLRYDSLAFAFLSCLSLCILLMLEQTHSPLWHFLHHIGFANKESNGLAHEDSYGMIHLPLLFSLV
eukprot:g13146.t1 g13146   contig8:4988-9008(+)